MQVGFVRAGALAVNGELTVRPDGTAAATSNVKRLDVDAEGVFNLGNNGLVVDYASNAASVLLDIESKISGGQLTGGGAAPAGAMALTGGSYGLGYGEASRVLGPGGGRFMGQDVDASAVLVRYTLLGDANLDARVDFLDLVALAQNYNGGGGRVWSEGDFNYDGAVNFLDLVSVAQNYNAALPAALPAGAPANFASEWTAALASVPEPASLLWVAGAFAALTGRRARSRPPTSKEPRGGCHA
jgi:hypothetical protein